MAEKDSRKIIIPVDGSAHSRRALDWYMNQFHRDGDNVVLIHAPEVPSTGDYPYTYSVEDFSEVLKKNKAESTSLLQKYSEELEKKNIPCTPLSQMGNPGDIICKKAEEEKACNIIMGSRGLGVVSRMLLGSVSNFVVNHSKVTVSIVPPEEQKKK